MSGAPSPKHALLSVSDKTNIVEFATKLHQLNFKLLSTGGTAKLLRAHHIPVTEVSEYTGFPEIMDGRVKTLHPKIHGGLLARPGQDDAVLKQHEITSIDLLVINLYPFAQTIANPQCTLEDAIENIDIGGPAMLRAGAKNYNAVTVIVDPVDYEMILQEIQNNGNTSLTTRFNLAKKVFAHTAQYDGTIANYLNTIDQTSEELFPSVYTVQFNKKQQLRYGENPHQLAALYTENNSPGIATAEQLQGKELSYNNIADADAAWECVNYFTAPTCVIVKHANPCGVATDKNILEAYRKAYATDPVSAFGGIIAFNQKCNAETVQAILSQQFVEVLLAPAFDPEALALLQQKTAIRVLHCPAINLSPSIWDFKRISGGFLIQTHDSAILTENNLRVVTEKKPTAQELQDLQFAWKVAKFVKSNAIVFAKNNATIGIGAGQMSRVDSVLIGTQKALRFGHKVTGSVMASDAFFPFRDSVDQAAEAGITAIIQPGGSIRDAEVIAAANSANISMIFTGIRHFRH